MKKPLVVITGASQGIGAALAKIFSKQGYSLGLLSRNLTAMEALNLPNTICIETDVTDISSFKQAIFQAEEKFGPVDCLINNAGTSIPGDFTAIESHEHEKMVQLNVMGVIHGIESVLQNMQTRKMGTIINISSLSDRTSRPQMATYAATKAAVKSLTESLRMANAQYGIRICNVSPAKILTPLLLAVNPVKNNQPVIAVEDFAKTVLWIYQQPQSICIRDMVIAPTYYEK